MKRGQRDGRGRVLVTVSLDDDDLAALDYMAEMHGKRRGKPANRSAVIRRLISIGAALERGQEVRDLWA